MSEPYDIDVLVIGLGPAGSRAAWAAARAGYSVLAIDRRQRPGFPVQCAEFVPAMIGQEIAGLEPLALQRITAMLTCVEGGSADLKPDFPGHMIDREAFDAYLVTRAQTAGADCRFGVQLAWLGADGTARFNGGGTVHARIVIGADGPRSAVGRATGRINTDLVETRQITVPLLVPHEATDIFLSAEIVGGYGWLFPKGETANLGLGVAPAARGKLKPLLSGLHEDLIAQGRVGRGIIRHTGGMIPVGGMLDPVTRLGSTDVLLAGDAAGLTNPVTGAGINAAVISGTLAGEAAAARLDGDGDALNDYRAELDALFGRSLARAVRRRRDIMEAYRNGERPSPAALRAGWIAYPEYWADAAPTMTTELATNLESVQ